MNIKIKIAIIAIGCFVVGFFSGREYLRYQLRSALQRAFTSAMAGPTNDSTPTDVPVRPPSPTEQPLTVSLLKKEFHDADPQNDDFESRITFTLQFANKTDKNIRAFDGTVTFTDLLDNTILLAPVKINKRIPAGQTFDWSGLLRYNQFIESHRQLRVEPKENLKVTFVTNKILFDDGTTKEY